MEEVKTSIEKIFDSFEASSKINTNAKRLSYSFLSSSGDGKWRHRQFVICFEIVCDFRINVFVGNRKSSDDSPLSPSLKRRRADDDSDISFNYSNISCNSTLNNSNQWEVRILKADLIEANTKVRFYTVIVRIRVIEMHLFLFRFYNSRKKSKIVHIYTKIWNSCTKDD